MKCPFCASSDTQVLESRAVEEGRAVRRRRECGKCGKRYTTYERVKSTVLWVIKKDGRREPFEREKVKRGILRAVEKRPISLDLVDDVVNQIEREMLKKEKEEVSSKAIGHAVLKRLKKIDKVAWLRFASVYLQFEDLEDFARAIKT
ncbi:transcriptional regulator NrdR [Candidatus Woesebacteria bacterium RIFCSPLOWO2_01_FULL_39_61]|uniref:Transcriptional repressor NrdR n=1 Tax=Candidatus Woesebacteria bacterium RIFCSPHIGHO2_02_FULL_39_13 TaxID=1802505 RepID=A0A1F7Z3E6_9BACT|nr:MAG: transcriptional regulator NrdR [Candidatus Woesebacteria bacterium RIFCSPHIGHO2_01_FULL_39_95]OGM33930.1 MAG: transcriptional regulator NrdR [Candidatus Woesebacteria bacterium RIFCSPHIGHO2_02_FULL_39_13]OGM37219.1 MAG: transcriptional regulator NrdR [Candidatus Woesebacteria bacterium RIFCSPHIGHO2_12_FULL_40_20]OGM65904.1 MAG: transcriptional regulator NrdR [Candidatus Woesebacteria bacterium RIFCSPLOWO2_01_FULL_39_61]OGM74122.1 MAG: transcriptional regulator NrdR [Candidatus Woesebact